MREKLVHENTLITLNMQGNNGKKTFTYLIRFCMYFHFWKMKEMLNNEKNCLSRCLLSRGLNCLWPSRHPLLELFNNARKGCREGDGTMQNSRRS